MLVSGALLPQRGAIFPALKSTGLSDKATRRAWAAFRGGVWQTGILLQLWRSYIRNLPDLHIRYHEGYRAIAADITAFWRPTLKNCPSKHYHPVANRALPAVIFGVVGEVVEIGGQRIACPLTFERVHPKDHSERRLWHDLLNHLGRNLNVDEVLVVDAGVRISNLHDTDVSNYIVRLATNFTARRNYLPQYCGKGRKPIYGQRIRPLARSYKNKATHSSPPDRVEEWIEDGRCVRAGIWKDLVLPDITPNPAAKTFNVYVIHDPLYSTPWLLASTLKLKAATVKAMYQDRWPVEQIPLCAKQMVGAHRQYVHAKESIQRLPELALLIGSVLSFLSATMPAAPTGFWDRQPRRTPGRFRRMLMGKAFPQSYLFPEQLRKKESVTSHLPKGILAHRRHSSHSPVVSRC